MGSRTKLVLRTCVGVGGVCAAYSYYSWSKSMVLEGVQAKSWPVREATSPLHKTSIVVPAWTPPTRTEVLQSLTSSSLKADENNDDSYDVLVIGGGAVGSGVALDCAKRGLKVALVERDDFASGTSSRSTKIIHGGIRYLAQAFQKKIPPENLMDVFLNLRFDKTYLDVVSADLHERAFMIQSAPFMTRPIPMMIPLYRWWEVPMMWVVGKMYDAIAGRRLTVPPSHLINRSEALYQFPRLKRQNENGEELWGALVVYDGQQNDTRMNLHIALTAAQYGATIANHCKVKALTFQRGSEESDALVNGAVIEDTLTGKSINVRAKQVINCGGVFSDAIRKMAKPDVPNIMVPSAGSHLVFPDYCSPASMGLVFFTKDGRVLYLLPWEGSTIAGTTDSPGELTFEPQSTSGEIHFIINECNRVLSSPIDTTTVRAAWSGLRPLVRDPNASPTDTKTLSREHVVEALSPTFLTVTGGKWTTYRKMAEDAVDKSLASNPLLEQFKDIPCNTSTGLLIGGDRGGLVCHRNFDENVVTLREQYGFDKDTAKHLSHNYGTRSLQLADMALSEKPGRLLSKSKAEDGRVFWKRLVPQYPILEAEVVFACRHELAETAVDVLGRRTRLAFLDVKAALASLPRILEIMQEEKGWSRSRKREEHEQAVKFLKSMYIPPSDSKDNELEKRLQY
eukprot:m.29272 g.29272  ORF g.29272 m.29272 type:complete len:680 (-) comp8085_c0_seq1:1866-3905(-)